jgi:hypothetical protein
MSDFSLSVLLTKAVRELNMQVEDKIRLQMVEILKQMIESGDFFREVPMANHSFVDGYIKLEDSSVLKYEPYRLLEKLKKQNEIYLEAFRDIKSWEIENYIEDRIDEALGWAMQVK